MITTIKNFFLDFSIIYSFDRSGFLRHKSEFQDVADSWIKGKVGLVTGGGRGIGKSVVSHCEQVGSTTYFTGRSEDNSANYLQFDLSNWDEIYRKVESLPKLDFLVLNAGGMSSELTLNKYGVEEQSASQIFGHYFLMKLLYQKDKFNRNAKVIWVTSGGMYLKKFDYDLLFEHVNYNRISIYANIKRAQVSLIKFFDESKLFSDLSLAVMHPGWVDTAGLKLGIPSFQEKFKGSLRSPDQGADTINWLLDIDEISPRYKLWFDRKVRSDSLIPWIRYDRRKTKKLIDTMDRYFKQVFDNDSTT